jgi:hypothetical protein
MSTFFRSSGLRAFAALALAFLVLGGCAGRRYDSADLTRAVAAEADVAARYGLDRAWWRAYGRSLNRTVDLARRQRGLAKSALRPEGALPGAAARQ